MIMTTTAPVDVNQYRYTCTINIYCPTSFYLIIQHYVIKFVSDLRQVSGFLWVLLSSTNKTDGHDITEILLKVALNTIIPPYLHQMMWL
jgi:hypothetical protein